MKKLKKAIWRILNYTRQLLRGKVRINVGVCPVCGKETCFIGNNSTHERPNDLCIFCEPIARNRVLAIALLKQLNANNSAL